MNNSTDLIQPDFVKFSFLFLFAILSTFCSSFIIYSFIRFSSIRKNFYYEIIIYLTFIILFRLFFNITISLGYYARGHIAHRSKHLCRFWQYVDYTSSECLFWCLAVFTIERYIIIFHPHNLRSKRQRIIFHYLPIILTNFYIIIFNIYSIIIIQCDNQKYNKHLCGTSCFDDNDSLSSFNWIFNIILPVFIIIFGSMILMVRVLWTRRKMQKNLRNWSKNWKMITQLLGISVVYTLVWIPLSIISLINTFQDERRIPTVEDNMYYLTYITDISVPTVVFIFSPDINRRLCGRVPRHGVSMISRTHT